MSSASSALPVNAAGVPTPSLPERNPTLYLDWLWQHYFNDIVRVNEVFINYCYPWKSRLGLIRLALDKTHSFIGLNSLLQLSQVPECVLITTIAHEMVHYTHGFGSPLPRIYKYPHANGVVDRELERRELGACLRCCNEWIDKYWYSFYDMQRESGWANIPGAQRVTHRGCR
jgi:hypothetical protein